MPGPHPRRVRVEVLPRATAGPSDQRLLQLDDAEEVRGRLVEPSLTCLHFAALEPGILLLRVEAEGFGVVRNRQIILLQGGMSFALASPTVPVLWLKVHRLGVVGEGLVKHA